VHMLENNVFYAKAMFFDTTSQMIYFDCKAYDDIQVSKIKTNYSCFTLNFFSLHNPHRSHSLIGHVIHELINK